MLSNLCLVLFALLGIFIFQFYSDVYTHMVDVVTSFYHEIISESAFIRL